MWKPRTPPTWSTLLLKREKLPANSASLAATKLPRARELARIEAPLSQKQEGRLHPGLLVLHFLSFLQIAYLSFSAVAALRIAHPATGQVVAHSPQTPAQPLSKLVPRA